jgi:hypothetical protein
MLIYAISMSLDIYIYIYISLYTILYHQVLRHKGIFFEASESHLFSAVFHTILVARHLGCSLQEIRGIREIASDERLKPQLGSNNLQ